MSVNRGSLIPEYVHMKDCSKTQFWALRYHKAGWPIFPCNNKQPLFEALKAWGHSWQVAIAQGNISEDVIRQWWTHFPNAQIALACGKKSGVVVVDIDCKTDAVRYPNHAIQSPGDIAAKLPPTLTSMTGGGGLHLFYSYRDVPNSAKSIHPQIDLKSEGGYVILPPSRHQNGQFYEWRLETPWDEDTLERLDPLPEILVSTLEPDQKENRWSDVATGVGMGSRNTSAASMAGLLINKLDPHLAWDLLRAWNTQNKPPLAETELQNTYISILKKHYGKHS